MPDNVPATGTILTITAGGALGSAETTVLMTVEETIEALAMSKLIKYRRPGESAASYPGAGLLPLMRCAQEQPFLMERLFVVSAWLDSSKAAIVIFPNCDQP